MWAISTETVSSSGTAGNGWFKGCTSLKSVTFADGLLRLENYLFEGCTSLTTIKLPATLQRRFGGLRRVQKLHLSCKSYNPRRRDGNRKQRICRLRLTQRNHFRGQRNQDWKRLVRRLRRAGHNRPVAGELSRQHAFRACAALGILNLPQAATLGANSFESCSALKEASIPKVAKISNYAFSNCGKLVSVSAAAATEAGDFAFFGCASLESISLPELKTLGKSAFAGCSSLKEFVAPNLTSIGDYAFCEVSESEDGTSVYNGCPLTGLDLTMSRPSQICACRLDSNKGACHTVGCNERGRRRVCRLDGGAGDSH